VTDDEFVALEREGWDALSTAHGADYWCQLAASAGPVSRERRPHRRFRSTLEPAVAVPGRATGSSSTSGRTRAGLMNLVESHRNRVIDYSSGASCHGVCYC
jgi:hypothetical protein